MSKEMREQIDKVKNWKQFLNESSIDIIQNIGIKYSKIDAIYHCSDDFRHEFDLEYVKGGNRGIHGWGVYFSSNVYKASTYGDYMTIVDKSNLNLLSLDSKITDEFIQKIKNQLNYNDFEDIENEIKTNSEYSILKDYNINNISDLKELKNKLEKVLVGVKNNKDYDEINNILLPIEKLLPLEKSDIISEFIFSHLVKNKDKTINDVLISFYNYTSSNYEKEFSLFFKKCNYDGFNYQDYEYVIFNVDKLKILEHVKLK